MFECPSRRFWEHVEGLAYDGGCQSQGTRRHSRLSRRQAPPRLAPAAVNLVIAIFRQTPLIVLAGTSFPTHFNQLPTLKDRIVAERARARGEVAVGRGNKPPSKAAEAGAASYPNPNPDSQQRPS